MNRATCMKEIKGSLEKGLNDALPENKKFMSPFFNTCGVLHKIKCCFKFRYCINGNKNSFDQV